MPGPVWSMNEINALDRDTFETQFGFIFEGSPAFVGEAWSTRPWVSVEALHQALVAPIHGMREDRQLALIRAHPDLVGRAALAGTLSPESTAEQRAAGLDPNALSPDDIASFRVANASYQSKFGFPFVICARENRKESILAGLESRLDHDRDREIRIALDEIGKIAWHRLNDVVQNDAKPLEAITLSDRYQFQVSYGKQGVAVYRVYATPLRGIPAIPESAFTGRDNNLLACEIDAEVFGNEFLPAYTRGDNSMVVATDSMKNFIIRETLAFPGATMEGLLHHLAVGFTTTYEQLHTLTLSGREIPFSASLIPDAHGGFVAGGNLFNQEPGSRAFASISVDKHDDQIQVNDHQCGISGIALMKLTGSAFTSFVRDDYTTLPERGDRPLFIRMDVSWRYADPEEMLDLARGRYVPAEQMRDLIAVTFDGFVSESIQHLIHEMGTRIMERFPQLHEIRFDALNLTRDPYGQRTDDPRVRIYSDPFPAYGRLTLTMTRKS